MSLPAAKTIYIAVFVVSAIACIHWGGIIGWALATIFVISALPLFHVICRASADALLTDVERRNHARANLQGRFGGAKEDQDSARTQYEAP